VCGEPDAAGALKLSGTQAAPGLRRRVGTVLNKRIAWVVAAAFTMVSAVGVAYAVDVPKDKAEIKLDLIKGKKGAVKFSHAKHASEYKDEKGEAIACKTCHHTDCHVADGEAQKEHNGKKAPFLAAKKDDDFDKKTVIFHKTCEGCHKKVAKAVPEKAELGKCKTCHGK
jgi:hypothetical protein